MVDIPIIQLSNVKKEFGRKRVLDNVNLQIAKGDIFGIIGLSGSGKTTLLNTLIGFFEPEEGEVLYNFPRLPKKSLEPIYSDINTMRRNFGFAPQNPSFYPKLTAEENLDHFGALYDINEEVRKNNIRHLLLLTDLYDARRTLADSLSGGMQKRLGIACALIHKPEVLILDEPTADLDPHLRDQTWELIKNINRQGTTIIMASHFLDEVELLCNKVGILHNGTILESGSPEDLRNKYSKNDEIHLESDPGKYDKIYKRLMRERSLQIKKVINKGKKIIIYTPKAEKTLHRLLHILESMNEKMLEVYVNRPSLGEVFESLTQK